MRGIGINTLLIPKTALKPLVKQGFLEFYFSTYVTHQNVNLKALDGIYYHIKKLTPESLYDKQERCSVA